MLGPIVLDLADTQIRHEEKELLKHPHVGGLILFARNFENIEQLRDLIKQVRQVRAELVIAVDQEGGRVQRFREGFTRLPAAGEFGKLYAENPALALQAAKNSGHTMAKELLAVGIDISLAPVLDVDRGISQVIGDRSFAMEADTVIQLAGIYIKGMQNAGMQAVGKHFPGHGAVAADSHYELPIDKRSYADIQQHDLLPFKKLHSQLAAVMPAHVIYEQVDEKPAGFSRFWLQTVLRGELNFQGAIISDDLSMHGAKFAGDYLDRAYSALEAGCDMLLICNNREGAMSVLDKLKYTTNAAAQQRLSSMKAKF